MLYLTPPRCRGHAHARPALDRAPSTVDYLIVIVAPNRDRKAERREATRREILAAAWEAAHENSLAGLTLRDIATRVGMQQPSLYSHFASKNAIYDGMFEQAWQTFLDYAKDTIGDLP